MILAKFLLLIIFTVLLSFTNIAVGSASDELGDFENDEEFLVLVKRFEQEIRAGNLKVPQEPRHVLKPPSGVAQAHAGALQQPLGIPQQTVEGTRMEAPLSTLNIPSPEHLAGPHQPFMGPQPPSGQRQAPVGPKQPLPGLQQHSVGPQPPSGSQQHPLIAQQQPYIGPQPPSGQQQPLDAQQQSFMGPQPPSRQQQGPLEPKPPLPSLQPPSMGPHPPSGPQQQSLDAQQQPFLGPQPSSGAQQQPLGAQQQPLVGPQQPFEVPQSPVDQDTTRPPKPTRRSESAYNESPTGRPTGREFIYDRDYGFDRDYLYDRDYVYDKDFAYERDYGYDSGYAYDSSYSDGPAGKVNDRDYGHRYYRHDREERRRELDRVDKERRRYEDSRDSDRRHEDTRDAVRRVGKEIIAEIRSQVQVAGFQQQAQLRAPPGVPYGESLYGHPGAFGGAPASELQDLRAFLVQKADALKELDGEIKELKTACEAEHALYLAQNETCTALQTECNTSQEAYDALNAECGANQTTHLSQISILTSTGEGLEIRLAACYEAKRLLLNEKMTAEKVLSAAAERVESLESDLKVCNTTLQAEQTARTLTNTSLAECNDRENATSTKLAQVAKAFNISEHRAHDHAEKHKIALNETQTTLNETEALYTECVASLAKQAITSAAAMNDSARAVAMCHSSARLETKKVYDLHVQVQKLTDELHKVEQDSLSRCTTAAPPTKLGPPTLNLPTLKPPASVLPPDVLQEVVTAEPSPTETLEAPADKETPQVGAECEKLAKNMTKKITQELTQNKTEELTQNITVELTQKITQELTEELTEKLAEREAAVSEVEKGLFVRENAVVKRETASQKEVQALKAENMRMIFREKQLMVRAQALDETMANGPDYDIVGALKEACTPTAVVGENAGHAGKPETSQPKDDGNPYVNINAKFSIKDDGATGNFAESQERLENAEARNAELSTEVMAARETIQALEKRLRQEHMVRGVLEEGIVPLYLLRPSLLMASTDKFVWGANVFVAFTSVLLFVLALMVFGGMLGRGGMSPAEVDALVHKKTSEAQQQIQQHPQHRPSSQSGEFNSALRTPEANPAAWLQEKLDDTLAAQHQMTDDIEVLNRNLSDRDRQIAKFRDLYAEVYASIKRPSGGNGRELLAIKAQLQEVQVKLRDEKDKFQRRETTFYALDQKNQREREEVREKFENDMRDLVADVKRLEGIVEARDIRLKELESDTAALNIELEEALQKVEKSDRSLDETIEKHRVSSDELRDELSLLKAKCATFELSGGIEESAAIEALQEKSKEEVAEVRKERDECLERINNYREQRDQQATKNAAQYTLLKAEKDANMKLREDVAELTRSCEMEVKKRIVYKKIMERDLEATRAEAAQNAAELATLNNKFKATVEILERSKRETATGNSSTGFSTLPTSQRETATGNSSAGFSTLPINLSPQVPAHNRPEPSQKKNLEMSPSATARDIVGASALTTVESEVVPLSIYMRAGDTSSLMGPPPSTKSDINISPTVPTINDKAQVSAKNLPDAAESADREDETPPAVTPMFFNPISYGKKTAFPSFPTSPKV